MSAIKPPDSRMHLSTKGKHKEAPRIKVIVAKMTSTQ